MALGPVLWDDTDVAGNSNPAALSGGPGIGNYGRMEVDVHYEVNSTDGSIHVDIDVSDPEASGQTWHEIKVADTSTSDWDRDDFIQLSTTFHGVRAYADSGDFSDSQVDGIEISSRLSQSR